MKYPDELRGLIIIHLIAILVLSYSLELNAKPFSPIIPFSKNFRSLPLVETTSPNLADVNVAKQNKNLKAREEFLKAIREINSSNQPSRDKAHKRLLMIIPKLNKKDKIAAHLIIARHLAGINANGHKFRQPQNTYQKHTRTAAALARHLPNEEKEQVFHYLVSIWQHLEPSGKPPFDLTVFTHTESIKAVIERSALNDWKNHNEQKALHKYETLAKQYNQDQIGQRLDQRILDMHQYLYQKSKNALPYQKALIAKKDKYASASENNDKPGAESQLVNAIDQKHFALVKTELVNAKKPADLLRRSRAIKIAQTFLNTADDHKKEIINLMLADVYKVANAYDKAVGIYMDLALNGAKEKKVLYYTLAIDSQMYLAHWPKEAPWTKIPTGYAQARANLLNMFEQLYELSNKQLPWPQLAHMGLLQISLNSPQQAFALWQKHIEQNPNHKQAAFASGFMLTAYHEAKMWDKLEEVTKLCLKLKIRPLYRNKSVNLAVLLSDALFFGGKEALAKQDYPRAITKFVEFNSVFSKDQRRPESYYLLAEAYYGDKKHSDAVKVLMDLANTYPQSQFYKMALYQGGEWSYPMAEEEATIFFWQKFLNQFATDSQASHVRDILVNLYLGRALYAEAAQIYHKQMMNTALPIDIRIHSARHLMTIEERYGDSSRAMAASDYLLKLGTADQSATGEALSYKVRFYNSVNDFAKIQVLADQLSKLSPEHLSVQEGLGQALFILAQSKEDAATKEIFNLELKDPLQRIKQQMAAFEQVKQTYDKVCSISNNSYCAPSMFKLARLSEKTFETLQDVEIPETLAEAEVNEFKQNKTQILSRLASITQDADTRSIELVSQGLSTPLWTSEILWQNSSDWNFDRINQEDGVGYLDWQARQQQVAEQGAAQ